MRAAFALHSMVAVSLVSGSPPRKDLRDAPSNTGTFYMNDILSNYDRVRLEDGSIITIGATTLILRAAPEEPQQTSSDTCKRN